MIWKLGKNAYLCSPFRQEEGCLSGGIGRRVGLKHQWGKTRIGSIPISGTEPLTKNVSGFFRMKREYGHSGRIDCRGKRRFRDSEYFVWLRLVFKEVNVLVLPFHQIIFPAVFFHEFRIGCDEVNLIFSMLDVFLVIGFGSFQFP